MVGEGIVRREALPLLKECWVENGLPIQRKKIGGGNHFCELALPLQPEKWTFWAGCQLEVRRILIDFTCVVDLCKNVRESELKCW